MTYHDQMSLPELLAPAGSFEHLKAAVKAGADAVYFGGNRFGARAYAENFTKEAVIDGIDYVHFHDRRAYMTVNTLLKEKELQDDLYDYLLPFYEAGLDGVIVQDLGAASFIHQYFPDMEVHGSTQMTITNVAGALQARKMGMNRIVPARELSGEEITRIKKETGLEMEVFIHGALCYCYSGQCLLSSTYGGRSGNRGRCAQPCRLSYKAFDEEGHAIGKEKHLLSPKDLCSLHNLPDMIRAGVDSLKIEGRMKNVDYVAGVTAIYRKYLDLYASGKTYKVQKEDEHILEELYSRSGFTDGYWKHHNGASMMSIDTPRHMGRAIGKITKIQKNQLSILLTEVVNPKDLLVISGGRQDEIVLTVPSSLDHIMHKQGRQWMISLNAPKIRWLRPDLLVYRRHNEDITGWIEKDILESSPKYPVKARVALKVGEAASLTLESRGDEIHLSGALATEAIKRPVGEEDIFRQMNKTGNVPFYLEEFRADIQGPLFMQASSLKELRQLGYERLYEEHLARFRRTNALPYEKKECGQDKSSDVRAGMEAGEVYACVYDRDTLKILLESSVCAGIVLPMDFYRLDDLIAMKQKIHQAGKKACIRLPGLYRQITSSDLEVYLQKTMKDEEKWDGIYINNINEFDSMKNSCDNIARVYSASVYQWNSRTCRLMDQLNGDYKGLIYRELPYELSSKECLDVLNHVTDSSTECMVYGRYPLMISAQCIKKTLGRCDGKENIFYLEDRQKRQLPVSFHCHPDWAGTDEHPVKNGTCCYNMIWTDKARDLIGEDFTEISGHISRVRLDFFACDPSEVYDVLTRYQSWAEAAFYPSDKKQSHESHWKIGVE